MYILTPDNLSLDTSLIPTITDTLHYCVLDHTETDDVDYKFPPMVFLEEYTKAAVELKIGLYTIQVPSSWSILLGEEDASDLELLAPFEFNGQDFNAFTFNPCAGYMSKFLHIEILNIYQDVKWNVPSLQPAHMLAVPLHAGENPICAFFAENKNKLPDLIDMRDMI